LSRKISYPLVAPDTLQVSVTSRCNLRCSMCNLWEDRDKGQELDFAQIRDVIDQSSSWGIGEINLCGGEPLLSEKCFKIIEHGKKRNMRIILTTNGTLINEDMARRIAASGLDIISISLDGVTADVHDKIRGIEGAYDKIIKGVGFLGKACRELKSPLIKVMIFTISNKNVEDIAGFINLAKNLCVDSIYFTSLVMDNVKLFSQSEDTNGLWITGDRLKILDKMIDEITSPLQQRYRFDYPSFGLIKKYFRRQLEPGSWTCFAGFRRFVLCPEGTIQMCGETIGHLKDESDIKKIWFSEAAQEKRKKILKCRNYCLQDCHAREESANLKNVFKMDFLKRR